MPTGLRLALGSKMIYLTIHFLLKFNSNALKMLSTKIHANFEARLYQLTSRNFISALNALIHNPIVTIFIGYSAISVISWLWHWFNLFDDKIICNNINGLERQIQFCLIFYKSVQSMIIFLVLNVYCHNVTYTPPPPLQCYLSFA